MSGEVLVTGGAGFLGSHLVDEPQTFPEDGLAEWVDWLRGRIAIGRVDPAALEVERRGLTL